MIDLKIKFIEPIEVISRNNQHDTGNLTER